MEEQLNGLKVMVIDDSNTIRRTAETLLSKAGCEVITPFVGFKRFSKIADTRLNLFFVDSWLPPLVAF